MRIVWILELLFTAEWPTDKAWVIHGVYDSYEKAEYEKGGAWMDYKGQVFRSRINKYDVKE